MPVFVDHHHGDEVALASVLRTQAKAVRAEAERLAAEIVDAELNCALDALKDQLPTQDYARILVILESLDSSKRQPRGGA